MHIRMADRGLERIFQYLLVFGHPDPVSLLSQEQWQQRFGFELLRHKACQQPKGR